MIALGGKANHRGPQVDKDTKEPVHINDSFRKAKRNSLLWSLVAVLSMAGTPVDKAGQVSKTELVPLYPLGLGFDQWVMVAAALVVAVYMFIGFERSLHPVNLMNSQRFRDRGLSDVPEAMEDLAAEIAKARNELKSNVERVERAARSAKSIFAAKDKLGSLLAEDARKLADDAKEDLRPLKSTGSLPGQAPGIAEIVGASNEMRQRIQLRVDETNKYSDNFLKRFDDHFSEAVESAPTPVANLRALTDVMDALASSARELTDYHRSVDKTDQDYLENYDIAPTEALFTVLMIYASFWWIDFAVAALI